LSAKKTSVAVVIPCYRVSRHVLGVLAAIGPEVDAIYVVDDHCPEGSGDLVTAESRDPRVRVLRNPHNQGVGGATLRGFRAALERGADIIVKLDGDGQMDPGSIPELTAPIEASQADYAKGNRFFNPDDLLAMPRMRLFGNALLSFMAKASTGYWRIFDPTNGFVAIDSRVLRLLPLDKLAKRYFWESDILFRLGLIRAVVIDVPMPARYGEEVSGLKIPRVILPFLWGHLRNFGKRILYGYFLRDFSLASVEIVLGMLLLGFGTTYGLIEWWASVDTGEVASSGTVMLAGLPVIVGVQLLLSALNYDVSNVPATPRVALMADRDSDE
jgi:glycosyltransferase involved in cell wall biosynthesis